MNVVLGYQENFPTHKKYISIPAFLAEVFDGEVDELRAIDICDYIKEEDFAKTITAIVKKTKIGGTFVIGGTDILGIADSLVSGAEETLNSWIFTEPRKYGMYTLEYLLNNLPKDIKYLKKNMSGAYFFVKGTRI